MVLVMMRFFKIVPLVELSSNDLPGCFYKSQNNKRAH